VPEGLEALSLEGTQWTRATLKVQMDLNQRESFQTRQLFEALRKVEEAQEDHSRQEEVLENMKNKTKKKEAALIRSE